MNDKRNFNDLYAFIQVVQAGNFSRAAKTLDVQPSALSHRIGALEARLGVKLLPPYHTRHVAHQSGTAAFRAYRAAV